MANEVNKTKKWLRNFTDTRATNVLPNLQKESVQGRLVVYFLAILLIVTTIYLEGSTQDSNTNIQLCSGPLKMLAEQIINKENIFVELNVSIVNRIFTVVVEKEMLTIYK